MHRSTIIERAYELARSGECPNVSDVKMRLAAEGYAHVNGHIYGSTITAALRRLCAASRPETPDETLAG